VDSQTQVQLQAAHQLMCQDGELGPSAVGPIVIGGHQIEGALARECGTSPCLGTGPVAQYHQAHRPESEIGRHGGVCAVAMVGANRAS
jgi:hypothetical protein